MTEYRSLPLQQRIAYQCGPVLRGVKIANLLIVSVQEGEAIKFVFDQLPIGYQLLVEDKGHAMILVYRAKQLKEHLRAVKQQAFMRQSGYVSLELEYVLRKLCKRYQMFQKTRQHFPHEIGILLGYPTEDVRSFIANKGKNYLAQGYWKVYHNKEQAFALFSVYDKAKKEVVQAVKSGQKLSECIGDCI